MVVVSATLKGGAAGLDTSTALIKARGPQRVTNTKHSKCRLSGFVPAQALPILGSSQGSIFFCTTVYTTFRFDDSSLVASDAVSTGNKLSTFTRTVPGLFAPEDGGIRSSQALADI
jgi:hypothetical protein